MREEKTRANGEAKGASHDQRGAPQRSVQGLISLAERGFDKAEPIQWLDSSES